MTPFPQNSIFLFSFLLSSLIFLSLGVKHMKARETDKSHLKIRSRKAKGHLNSVLCYRYPSPFKKRISSREMICANQVSKSNYGCSGSVLIVKIEC